ncbi:hypothetical protein ACTMTJ_42500 [Phytohabitans sp. LJ34]|uniref:hypothetical protein n=1 Tax=Phytohabitans sp. LJ34 TaxID=3452217 RepID=UPI003F8AA479
MGNAIRNFVERVNSKWKLGIKAHDYEVRSGDAGCVIQPKDASSVTTQAGARSAGTSMTTTTTTTIAVPPAKSVDGGVTIQQDTKWQEPQCRELTDPEGAGFMQTCLQWGNMDYQGATRRNLAVRTYASCGARAGSSIFQQISECYVSTEPYGSGSTWVWNDWSPKSTAQLNPCGTVGLSIGVGPVSASSSVNTCEKLVPARGSVPSDFRATWMGESYYAEDVRETGALIAFGIPHGGDGSITWKNGYTIQECVLPGVPSPYLPYCAV